MIPMTRNNLWLRGIPNGDLGRVRRDLDATLEHVLGSDGSSLSTAMNRIPLSAWESDDHYVFELDVPGVAESDVEVTLHEGQLHLRWERPVPEGRTYLYNGRHFGRSEQVLILPDGAARDGVEALIGNGVLTLRVPKAAEAKPRKIDVKRS